jgi:hypothetical protein
MSTAPAPVVSGFWTVQRIGLRHVRSPKKFVLTLRGIVDNVSALSHGVSLQVAYAHAAQFAYHSSRPYWLRNARRRTGSSTRRWRAVAGFSQEKQPPPVR